MSMNAAGTRRGAGSGSPRTKGGVLLVRPSLERNLDPHALHEIHYACSHQAIAALGRRVRIVDPRDVAEFRAAIASDDYEFVITERSQSEFWPLPAPGTEEFRRATRKVLITFAGNPPFYGGSFGFHRSPFTDKVTVLHDHDSIAYAETINLSGARFVPGQSTSHDVDLEDEAAWLPPSRRPVPILFVGTYTDPDSFRLAWRQAFARFPRPLAAIEGAAELLDARPRLPVWQALAEAVEALAVTFDLRSKAGRTALELLSRFSTHRARQAVLDRVARFPSRIVANELPALGHRHPGCIVTPGMSFRAFLGLLKDTRCLVTTNPNGMTGAVSERVPNAMRRGAVVLHAANNTLDTYRGAGLIMLDDRMAGLDARLEAATAPDAAWDELGEQARGFARQHLRMDRMYEALLAAAERAAAPDRR